MAASASSRWVPLESDPEVYNQWARKAGLASSEYRFMDVYGLDPETLSTLPKPSKAVILIFPGFKEFDAKHRQEAGKLKTEGQYPLHPDVFYVKQTISNACGTMAIIHALTNSGLPFEQGSPLADLMASKDKTPEERAKILEGAERLASIHHELATGGQSIIPPNLYVEHHYTAFVETPPSNGNSTGRVVELDGSKVGPMDRGPCEDLLNDVARYVKQAYIEPSGRTDFNLIAFCRAED